MPSKEQVAKQDLLDELDRARREADRLREMYGYVLPYTAKRVIDLERQVQDAL